MTAGDHHCVYQSSVYVFTAKAVTMLILLAKFYLLSIFNDSELGKTNTMEIEANSKCEHNKKTAQKLAN